MNIIFAVLIALHPVRGIAQDGSHQASAKALAISFTDLETLVLKKNENIKASRMMIEAGKTRTGHLARSFFPQLSATLGHESFQVPSLERQQESFWRLGAQINLYRGGRDAAEESLREGQLELTRAESSLASAAELRKAQDAYWDIVAHSKILTFREQELTQNEANIRAAGRRAGAGVATNADRVQFELYRAELEQKIEELKLDIDFAKSKLAVALGLPEHSSIHVAEDFPALNKELPKAVPLESRVAMRTALAHEKIETFRAQVAGRWWRPSVDLYAGYGVPALDDEYERAIRHDRETVAGLRVSFDLGQGLKDDNEARSKAIEAKARGYNRAYTAREVEAEEHELEHHMSKALEFIREADKNLDKAKSFMNLTRTEYQRGVKNGPDLQAASRQYFELNERKIVLTREYLEHKSALGVLNTQVGTH